MTTPLQPLALGGATVWVGHSGRRGGPMLLYLHGGPGIAEAATRHVFAEPLRSRFHLVCWEQRGAGRSADEDVTVDRLVADLASLVAHLRDAYAPPSLTLVGHSWGSLLGLLGLARASPAIDGFVAIGPLAGGPANEPTSLRVALERCEAERRPVLRRLLRLESAPYGRRALGLVRKTVYLWALGGAVRPRRTLPRLALSVWTGPTYPPGDKLAYPRRAVRSLAALQPEIERLDPSEGTCVGVPVLFCVGRHDLLTPPPLARDLFDRLEAPAKEWVWFEGCAHSPHYERPAAFASVLADWHARTLRSSLVADADRDRAARDLVRRFGGQANAYRSLAPGLQRLFAAGGDGFVAYARHGRVRVAAGAPVASADDVPAVAEAFEADARRDGDGVCWFGVEGAFAQAAASRTDRVVVRVAAQPVWDPRGWPEVVRRHRSVRSQLQRARNKGVVVGPARDDERASLRALQAAWLERKSLPRLHFLTAADTLDSLPDRRLLVARTGGVPVAFLVASPVPAREGWAVEQIVRAADAPNGTSELLIDGLMRSAAAEGCRYLTLGPVPLSPRAQGPHQAPTWLAWLLRLVRAHGRRFYDFRGLEYFKAKLMPDRWETLYAVSLEPAFSLGTVRAVARAFAGGGAGSFATRALVRAAGAEVARAVGGRAR